MDKRGDVSWYGPARGGWVFSLVQCKIVSRHLLQIYTGRMWLPPWHRPVPLFQYLVLPLYIWCFPLWILQETPNLIRWNFYSAVCIHRQKFSHFLFQGMCHVPVVVYLAAVICSRVNQHNWHIQHPMWPRCAGKCLCWFLHFLQCLIHHIW